MFVMHLLFNFCCYYDLKESIYANIFSSHITKKEKNQIKALFYGNKTCEPKVESPFAELLTSYQKWSIMDGWFA